MKTARLRLFVALVSVLPALRAVAVAADDWTLKIVPTEASSKGRELNTVRSNHYYIEPCFQVVLANVSSRDLYIWKEWCSWGYFCLEFTITLPDGKVLHIEKHPAAWTKNFPDPYLVRPGEYYVWNVKFQDEAWDGFPPNWHGGDITIQAYFTIKPGADDMGFGIKTDYWTGSVSSKPMAVHLIR